MEWKVLRAGPDTEREHLNKILAEIRSEINAINLTNPGRWTYLHVESTQTVSSASNTAITELSFTPDKNREYEIEAILLVQTAAASIGARVGVNSWPTGLAAVGGAVLVESPGATTSTQVSINLPAGTTGLTTTSDMPLANTTYLALVHGIMFTGPSVSGNFTIGMATETAPNNVRMMAGSHLRYRVTHD